MLQQNDDHLAITWTPGFTSSYHWLWLRDSCQCAACLNSHCRQKYFDPATIPLDIRPKTISKNDGEILIIWNDGHQSLFATSWLREHDYSHLHLSTGQRHKQTWVAWTENNIAERATFPYAEIMREDSSLDRALRHLFDYGLIIISSQGTNYSDFDGLCTRLAGFVDRSYFGEFFDLEVKSDDETDSVSFSTKQLPLHTDIPYYLTPPDFQFLFGLNINASCAESGDGKTRFVDGLAAALQLKQSAPEAFDILATTEVTYRAEYPWADKVYHSDTTIIQIDSNGDIVRLANNPSKMFFERVPFDSMMPLYRAYSRFKKILQDADYAYAHTWSQEDMIVFDNRRIFHGREEFSKQGIKRTLRGGYFREVELMARSRFLMEKALCNQPRPIPDLPKGTSNVADPRS